MPLVDGCIPIRETILDLLTRRRQSRTLNAGAPLTEDHSNLDPAQELQNLLREILASFVDPNNGNVDYRALRASPAYAMFRACLGRLRTFDPSTLTTREEQLAFWINLYNTLIVDGVIALEVKRSITERWAGFAFLREAAYIVNGQRVSCDDIEHGILRGNRGHPFLVGRQFRASDPRRAWVIQPPEARIHFALNCASRSCPPIRVYSADKLNEQLDMATRNFLADDVNILTAEKEIHLSAIFKWFAGDFGGREGTIEFLSRHLPNAAVLASIEKRRGQIVFRYKPYDWRLNGKSV